MLSGKTDSGLAYTLIICLLLFFWPSFQADGLTAGPLQLQKGQTYTIGKSVSYYRDKSAGLNISQVTGLPGDVWLPGKQDRLSFGIDSEIIWLKGSLLNTSTTSQWNLICEQRLEHINFYLYQNGQLLQEIKGGIAAESATGRLPNIHLQLQQGQAYEFYISIQSTTSKRMPFYLEPQQNYIARLVRLNGINYVFFAFIFIMIAVNTLLFWRLKSIVPVYYIAWAILIGLFQFVVAGYWYVHVVQSIWWNNRLGLVFSSAAAIILILFWDQLLLLRVHAPGWKRALQFFIPVYIVFLVIALLPEANRLLINKWIHISAVLFLIVLVGSGIATLWRGFRPALFTTIGTGFFIASLIAYSVGGLGMLPSSYFTDYAILFGYVSEAFFFLISISVRLSTLQAHGQNLNEKQQIQKYQQQYTIKRETANRNLVKVDTDRLHKRLKVLMEEERIFYDEDLDLERLARMAGVNRHQLSEFLNNHLGQKFHAYINSYRIKEACHLLRIEKDRNILQIALSVGFNSKSVFNTEFKKQTGQTPSEYRADAD